MHNQVIPYADLIRTYHGLMSTKNARRGKTEKGLGMVRKARDAECVFEYFRP